MMFANKHSLPGGSAVHAALKKDKKKTLRKQCVIFQMLVQEGQRFPF